MEGEDTYQSIWISSRHARVKVSVRVTGAAELMMMINGHEKLTKREEK